MSAWYSPANTYGASIRRRARSAVLRPGAERGGGAVLAQHLGDGDGAALVVEIFHDRHQCARGCAGPVEGVHEVQLAVAAEPDVQPPGLVIGGVRAGGDL